MTDWTIEPARAIEFVVDEARLLDAKRFDEWHALFADDGVYWMPLVRGQTDMKLHTSLLHEDPFQLRIRIERLSHPRVYAQQPASYCHHLLQTPSLESVDALERSCRMRTEFHYTEVRASERISLAGTAHHRLVERDGRLRIALKRVDLLECEAPLPSIHLII